MGDSELLLQKFVILSMSLEIHAMPKFITFKEQECQRRKNGYLRFIL